MRLFKASCQCVEGHLVRAHQSVSDAGLVLVSKDVSRSSDCYSRCRGGPQEKRLFVSATSSRWQMSTCFDPFAYATSPLLRDPGQSPTLRRTCCWMSLDIVIRFYFRDCSKMIDSRWARIPYMTLQHCLKADTHNTKSDLAQHLDTASIYCCLI